MAFEEEGTTITEDVDTDVSDADDVSDIEGSPSTDEGQQTGAATAQAATEGTTATPPATLSHEESLAKIVEMQAQLDLLQPYQQYNEAYGSAEAIQPAISLLENLYGEQIDGQNFFATLEAINPAANNQLKWHLINENLDVLAQDAEFRETVLKNDPEYQQFLSLKNAGVDFSEVEQKTAVDPETTKMRAEFEQMKREQTEAKEQKFQADLSKYRQENIFDFIGEKLSKINFGKEYNDLKNHSGITISALTSNDAKCQEIGARIEGFMQKINALPAGQKNPLLEQALKSQTKVLQNRVAELSKAYLAPIDKLIQENHMLRSGALKQQQAKPTIPGGGSVTPETLLSGLGKDKTPEQIANALWQNAVAAGRANGYPGDR